MSTTTPSLTRMQRHVADVPVTWSQAEQDLFLRMSCTPVLDRLLAWSLHHGYDISTSEGVCSRYEEYDAFMTRGEWANHPTPWKPARTPVGPVPTPGADPFGQTVIVAGWPHDKPRTLVAVPEETKR